jgi:hypothetical protein
MLSLEEGDNGEDASMIVLSLRERQLGQDAAHVLVDGPLADPELAGDTRVGSAFGHELKDLALARGEVAEGIVNSPRGDELSHEPGVDDRAAAGDAFQRLEKVAHLGDAALQQIPHASPFREQVHRTMELDVRGQNEDADLRELGADRLCGVETLGGMRRGHPNIEHHESWAVLPHQPHQVGHVARQADDLKG